MNKISVDRLVNNIMNDYDRNNNKTIDLDKKHDESFFDDSQITQEGNQTVRTVTRYSNDALFLSADKNKDNNNYTNCSHTPYGNCSFFL